MRRSVGRDRIGIAVIQMMLVFLLEIMEGADGIEKKTREKIFEIFSNR